jgi:hypothetical protein
MHKGKKKSRKWVGKEREKEGFRIKQSTAAYVAMDIQQ